MHCHYCTMCSRLHGSAFSTYVFAMPPQIDWEGEDQLAVFRSSATGTREFYRPCGSVMRATGQAGNGQVEIPAGTLHGNPPLSIFGHIFAEGRPDWDVIADEYPQYAGFPQGYGPGCAAGA